MDGVSQCRQQAIVFPHKQQAGVPGVLIGQLEAVHGVWRTAQVRSCTWGRPGAHLPLVAGDRHSSRSSSSSKPGPALLLKHKHTPLPTHTLRVCCPAKLCCAASVSHSLPCAATGLLCLTSSHYHIPPHSAVTRSWRCLWWCTSLCTTQSARRRLHPRCSTPAPSCGACWCRQTSSTQTDLSTRGWTALAPWRCVHVMLVLFAFLSFETQSRIKS